MNNKPNTTRIVPLSPKEMRAACNHPDHNPPMHIVIPHGHKLVHECPSCGKRVEIPASSVRFGSPA